MGRSMSLDVEPAELAGRLARDAHGRPLGEVEAVFDGRETRFVGIDTERGRVVVPVDGAEVDPAVYALDLPYMTDRISAAPTVAADAEKLDADVERRVIEHFGKAAAPQPEPTAVMEPVADDELPTATAAPEPEPVPAPDLKPHEEEVTLTEEQLVVETERVPAQRVRVRKEIVEEEVTVTVRLRHEELVIEREPIKPGEAPPETADGPRLDEPPIEIVLWAEEPVVSTRAVPTERVRVLRTLGSEQQDLTAQLRRERASFEHPTEEDQR
jgi:uncharacterized protein (TIGR02271 family)